MVLRMKVEHAERSSILSAVRRLLLMASPFVAVVFGSFLLKPMPYDGPLARIAFWFAESGSERGIPWLIGGALLLILSRPGAESTKRRVQELALLLAVLSVFLLGAARANEYLLKPALAVPRPNIVALNDAGILRMAPKQFYELGDKAERRKHLKRALGATLPSHLRLDPRVHAHWLKETGFSFPSGHATAAMTTACFIVGMVFLLGLRGWRRCLYLALPWATAVCYSRPLLGVHSALDVSVGAVQGLCWGVTAVVSAGWLMGKVQAVAAAPPAS